MADPADLILNVNDVEAARYMVTLMLRKAGFRVLEAATGADGLRLAHEAPAAIVLDVRLPDMSGYEVCRQLKATPDTQSIPVLLTSAAHTRSEHRVEGLDAGADAFLIQPFDASELSATVRALLRIRRAERDAQRLAEELGDAVKVRDEFLSIASHELKTPLTSLQLQLDGLERLLRAQAAAPSERLGRKVEIARRQTERLTVLVDDLLDVSRITQGHFSMELEDVELDAIAREVVERFSDEAVRARCELTLRAQRPVRIRADALRLDQVLTNLVSNALKYGAGAPIDVEVSAAQAKAQIAVRDRGIGIDPADRERIFGRFERAVSVNHFGGLGLGLFISKQIVEAHGGTICAQPGAERGSEFIVTLPSVPWPA